MMERRASSLSPSQMYRLDLACRDLREAFGGAPYLVGSAVRGGDFRDVDVRLMLPDDKFAEMDGRLRVFIGLVTSAWLSMMSGLPVDFQLQDTTEANLRHTGVRNALGMRGLPNFTGDWATPQPNEGTE